MDEKQEASPPEDPFMDTSPIFEYHFQIAKEHFRRLSWLIG